MIVIKIDSDLVGEYTKYLFKVRNSFSVEMEICICISEITTNIFKTGGLVYNNNLNLCVQVENSQWLLWCRKADIKDRYL